MECLQLSLIAYPLRWNRTLFNVRLPKEMYFGSTPRRPSRNYDESALLYGSYPGSQGDYL